jgi:hypothetical protein
MTANAIERPLGVRPDVVLSDTQLRRLRTLAEYDLAPVRERLLRDGAMPSSWLDEALLEFRRYLGLHLVSPEPLTMFSHQVDAVWHTCLLFSRLYADLCQQIFGQFIHHDPWREGKPGDERHDRWQEFRDAYVALYGEPGRLWGIDR